LIVVYTSGPVIDAGGGRISAGMWGSPVYADDGKLVGAIAYGFSVGPIGGVTPAPGARHAPGVRGGCRGGGQGSAVTRLLPGSRARIARTQGVAPSSVADEMGRLKVPVSVSRNPRAEQLSALRDALTGAGRRDRHPRCERHRLPGTTFGEAAPATRLAPRWLKFRMWCCRWSTILPRVLRSGASVRCIQVSMLSKGNQRLSAGLPK
jgi:hypothetical protein